MTSTAQSHPSFPSRPYSGAIHGKLPERTGPTGPGPSFGASSRENARLERERQDRERAQREAVQQAAGPVNPLANITEEQREEINEAFGLFDLDKDQRIDYHEFKVSLKALGFDLPKSEILSLLTQHGIPPDSSLLPPPQGPSSRPGQGLTSQPRKEDFPSGRLLLTLPAFQSIAAKLIVERDPKDEILRAFQLFDTEDKGYINIDDLRRVARELGEGLEEDELMAMIEEFDLEGKGGVGREEFVGICMG